MVTFRDSGTNIEGAQRLHAPQHLIVGIQCLRPTIIPASGTSAAAEDAAILAKDTGGCEVKRLGYFTHEGSFDRREILRLQDRPAEILARSGQRPIEMAVNEVNGEFMQAGDDEEHNGGDQEPNPARDGQVLPES